MNTAENILEFQGITKRFFGVPVLQDVTFAVPRGGIVGLVGENGAGKSTLMNILGGVVPADGGRMLLGGRPYAPRDARAATRHGVAFIHQELNLFANLTLAENLRLTDFPRRGLGGLPLPLLDRPTLRRQAAALLAEVGLQRAPDTPLEALSPGERQLVEIAKALGASARLIIFDEPTTSLTSPEAQRLFQLMGRLRQRGVTLIYISHQLPDVLRLCGQVIVLRDGAVVGGAPAAQLTEEQLITLMVGRRITQMFPTRTAAPRPEVALEARGLGRAGVLHDVSFALHRGEVLGLSGLMGAGRTELLRLLFGADRPDRGAILLHGRTLPPAPRRAIRAGLAFLTENRREEGLLLEDEVGPNVALAALPAYARAGWIHRRRLRPRVEEVASAVALAAGQHQVVRTLSGGNQQKVVLGKWLMRPPAVLLLDEPTRGIDVAAKHEIYQLIARLADQGVGILLVSSELEELLGLSDRILVLSGGRLRGELSRPDFDREAILRLALAKNPKGLSPSSGTDPLNRQPPAVKPRAEGASPQSSRRVPGAESAKPQPDGPPKGLSPSSETDPLNCQPPAVGPMAVEGVSPRSFRSLHDWGQTPPAFLSRHAPLLLLALVLAYFGFRNPAFLHPTSLVNLLVHSASIGIVATGMTLVLLTGGIDLSVGAIMFVAAAIAGKLVLAPYSWPVAAAVALILPLGLAFGLLNGLLITRLRMLPFVVTLATLFMGRGFATWLTETKEVKLPPEFLAIGQATLAGIPLPLLLLAAVMISAHLLLTATPFGRQLYAVGHDAEMARKAGIQVPRVLLTVYILSGLCAAIGALVSVAQLATVSPTFGRNREFDAIAAAVVGGVSLFGGRGSVLPGTLLGAVLMRAVESGLNMTNANPYVYPMVIAAIIFLAVLVNRSR